VQVTSVGRSDDGREDTAEPAPVVVVNYVGRVGDQRSVVSVELTRLVGGTDVAMWIICVMTVAADQSALSGCGLNDPIRWMHQNASYSATIVCVLSWQVLSAAR